MRRYFLIAALAGTILATPALADVTVRYKATLPAAAPANVREAPPVLTIAADGTGQARWEMAAPGTPAPGARQPSISLIAREGTGYFVMSGPGPGMQIVGRVDDAFSIGAQLAAPVLNGPARDTVRSVLSQRVEITPVGPETVSGIRGNLYRIVIVTGESRTAPLEVVISTDPRLAPIGREFVRMLESVRPTVVAMAGGEPQVLMAMRGLTGLGAPLRIGTEVRVDSVSTDDVPDSQFALPGPPMTREQLQQMLGMMMGMMGQRPGASPAETPTPAPAPAPAPSAPR